MGGVSVGSFFEPIGIDGTRVESAAPAEVKEDASASLTSTLLDSGSCDGLTSSSHRRLHHYLPSQVLGPQWASPVPQ